MKSLMHGIALVVFVALAVELISGQSLSVFAADMPGRLRFSARAANADCQTAAVDVNDLAFVIDAERIAGVLLPPVRAPAGKFVHRLSACDPEGDAFTIVLAQAPAGFGLAIDDAQGIVTLSGDLSRGVHYLYFQLADEPGPAAEPCAATYTLVAQGLPRPNRAPVLY